MDAAVAMRDPTSEPIQDSWMSFACSQTDHLLQQTGYNPSEGLIKSRTTLTKHLDALRATENLLRQRLNFLLPIYRLPDEVLTRIFVHACAVTHTNPPLPTKLMTVSHRWCTVVRSFPEVWAYPPLCYSPKVIDATLSRVKAAPVHLNWEMLGTWVSPHLRNADYGPLFSRCQSLTLLSTTTKLEVVLASLRERAAPLLETMSIIVDRASRDRDDPEMTATQWPKSLFGGSTPPIRELHLKELAYFDWSSTLLSSGLTHLDISFVHYSWLRAHPHGSLRADCSFEGLLDALEHMPNLIELELTHCVSTSWLFGALHSQRQVILPNLQLLIVYDSLEACARFSQVIPSGNHTTIVYHFPYRMHQDLGDIGEFIRAVSMEGRFTSLEALVEHVDSGEERTLLFDFYNDINEHHLCIRASAFKLQHTGVESSTLFESPYWYRDLWTAMATSLPVQHVLHLYITIHPDAGAITKSMWLKSFAHASGVTRLHVESGQVPSLSHALCHHRPSERKASKRLFPRLAVLSPLGMTGRDMFMLKRALDLRTSGRSLLGFFYIQPENCQVRIPRWYPHLVRVEQDVKRVLWRVSHPVKVSFTTAYFWLS
ncbi:hypothetical protein PENSPDRAFT_753063 [Peniophora sp. CONT]|nr:hypothetical protein PENSPDRAFT_753063 [Peniophora sp. CONT]